MNMNRCVGGLQTLGQSLLLPMAALPVAVLLLRLGQPDLLSLPAMYQAGAIILCHMGMIFAVAVAIGFSRGSGSGYAGLAAAVGYVVLTALFKVQDDQPNLEAFLGVAAGLTASAACVLCDRLRFPPLLAFCSGKRFAPIATGAGCALLAGVFYMLWPIAMGLLKCSESLFCETGRTGLFLYGFLNRILLLSGLHHVLNSGAWFAFGSFSDASGQVFTGDLARFQAGDPCAGGFMAGFFPVMMFGLPAACLAMYRGTRRESKKVVAGLLIVMALASLLTGVAEPIELCMVFLSPFLYLAHAVLTGLSMVLMQSFQVRLGFSFSAGLFDFLSQDREGTRAGFVLLVGMLYFALYYLLVSAVIRYFGLWRLWLIPNGVLPVRTVLDQTGRGATWTLVADRIQPLGLSTLGNAERLRWWSALGGRDNVLDVKSAGIRLRVRVAEMQRIDLAGLKTLGVVGVHSYSSSVLYLTMPPDAHALAFALREEDAGPR